MIIHLLRLHKPVGTLLLFFPCAMTLALFKSPVYYYIVFAAGALVMRSAGCIINDIWDRKIDAQVERTKNRPLANNTISMQRALIILSVLCIMGLYILCLLPKKTIIWGLCSLPLVVLYPLAKRYFFWPQIVLAIVFNWGVIMAAVTLGQGIPWDLYAFCVIWTLGYDTLYSCQDIVDDKKLHLKSGAILFEGYVKWMVIFLYFVTISGFQSFIVLEDIKLVGFVFILMMAIWNPKNHKSTALFFNLNIIIGIWVIAGILLNPK